MTSPSGRNRSDSYNRRNRMQPLSTPSPRPTQGTGGTGDLAHNRSGSGGSGSLSTRQVDSSSAEALQSSPVLDGPRPSDSTLLFPFDESLSSRTAAHCARNNPAFSLESTGQVAFEQQYLTEAMHPPMAEGRSFDRSSIVQSTSGTNSPLANIQHMQPAHPSPSHAYYGMPIASGSQERLEDDMRALMTSASDNQSFPRSYSSEQGGSPSMDPNALQSDADTPSILMHHDFPPPKSGYRREIEAKSRNKIRIAAQRLRNVISPLVRPGVTLRGTADVMEEAADQIIQMAERVRQMEMEVNTLRLQLQAKAQIQPARQW